MTPLTLLGLWLGGMLLFALWDAYVGFGVEFDGQGWPPALIAYCFWPITLPCAVMASFAKRLDGVKDKRIKKAEQKKKIRIAAEREQEVLLQQLEREMMEDEQSVQTTRSRRSTRS